MVWDVADDLMPSGCFGVFEVLYHLQLIIAFECAFGIVPCISNVFETVVVDLASFGFEKIGTKALTSPIHQMLAFISSWRV